jgi:5'-nucleotidase
VSAERAVAAASSVTTGTANRLFVARGSSVDYAVQVVAFGIEPVGTITVFDGRRAVGTIELEAGDGGRGTLTITDLSRGMHRFSAEFSGSETVRASSTKFAFRVFVS